MTEYPRPDASHVPDFVIDRGPAEHFHGRERILANFSKLAKTAVDPRRGTIFLIQGAPGAGKTALLHECKKFARRRDWEITEIDPPALWDLDELLYYLGKEDNVQFTGGSGEIGINAGVRAGVKLNVESNQARPTILKTLQDGEKPLLLVLDEAQALGIKDVVPSNQKRIINSVLNNIHNGRLKRSIILLAAGLGPTKATFGELGISRFRGGCFVELGALGKKAERAVIHDWLTKNGGAKGDPTPWIDAITQKTHGWPQHITIYGEAAAKQIKKDQGHMTPSGLETVSRVGMERREEYYKQRAITISRKERCSLARLIKNVSPGNELDREDIVIALSQEYDPDEAKNLFNKAVERGILHSQDGIYTIPIPSLRNWLVSEYAPEKNTSPAR